MKDFRSHSVGTERSENEFCRLLKDEVTKNPVDAVQGDI